MRFINSLNVKRSAKGLVPLVFLTALVSACGQPIDNDSTGSQTTVNETAILNNAQNMQVRYKVISNTKDLDCDASQETQDCYASQLALFFMEDLPAEGWYIMFSHLSPMQSVTSDHFAIEHINGDLHKLRPKQEIEAQTTYRIDLISQFWSVSKTDVLPNYFFVYNNEQTAVIENTTEQALTESAYASSYLPTPPHAGEFTSPAQYKRTADDKTELATPSAIYMLNKARHQGIADTTEQGITQEATRTVPAIANIQRAEGELSILQGLDIIWSKGSTQPQNLNSLLDVLLEDFTISQRSDGVPVTVYIEDNSDFASTDSYQIKVNNSDIIIHSPSEVGVSYAFVTLMQLLNEQKSLPQGIYKDSPQYPFRGLHLDVSRNFRSLQFVKQLIKQMHFLKLNKLHLHLADDEGWRLEVDGLEELTQIGAYRCFDPSEQSCLLPQLGSGPNKDALVNGYYTNADYIEILQHARMYGVDVIPSLDMPGHSRAAVKAMEARYKRFMEQGNQQAAKEYLLSDFNDTTQYSSVQHYHDNTINVCMASTYRFVDKVFSHLLSLHEQARVPLNRYHIGADETAGAWFESPVCQEYIASNEALDKTEDLSSYFVARVAALVQDKGIIAGGWSDGMGNVDKTNLEPMQVNVWDTLMSGGHKAAYEFTQNNWRTILSFPDVLYFDFPYAASPDEHGYYWATRATDTYKVFQFNASLVNQNARLFKDRMGAAMQVDDATYPSIESVGNMEGIQGHLWSEVVRHDSVAQYMLFPRIAGLAERAWVKPAWQGNAADLSDSQLMTAINNDWKAFSEALISKVLPYLANQNVHFRVPPPGAYFDGNAWQFNHIFAGALIQYQDERGNWQDYKQSQAPIKASQVRAKIPNTQRYSRTLGLNRNNTQ